MDAGDPARADPRRHARLLARRHRRSLTSVAGAVIIGEHKANDDCLIWALQDPPRGESPTLVKHGGTAALTEAEARADQARYQEVTCRSALNRVEGHAVQLDPQPLPGLHARLPLLLCPPLSRAVRNERRRRVRVGDSRQAQHRRGSGARAGSSGVDARAGRGRHRDRPVSADRRSLQTDAGGHSGADPRPDADGPGHEGADGGPGHRRARRAHARRRAARSI